MAMTARDGSRVARTRIAIAIALLALGASARVAAHGGGQHAARSAAPAEQHDWGIAGDPRRARRTIVVSAHDTMRFEPDRLEIVEGETVRIVVANRGATLHELVLGTPQALREHAAAMAKFPGMEHDEAHMVHVPPGRRGEVAWTFNRPGEFQFACLLPGHYEAGMLGTIVVRPRPKR